MTASDRLRIVTVVRSSIADGSPETLACGAAGVSVPTYQAWARRMEEGGIAALADQPRSGRPPAVTLLPEEAAHLHALALRANRGRDASSMTAAARHAAIDPASPLRPETRGAILAPRASKHQLPVEIRRACRVGVAEVRRYRDPSAGLADGIHAPGLLRMAQNPDGTLRRLLPGERQVWDDASVNVGVCLDWPAGGDRCSDRWGVRVARYQLLLGIDCATDFCVGYNYVVRGNDAYRAEDVVRSWHRVWSTAGMPDACVVEGGSWQSARALEYLGAAGVAPVSAKGRPWQKLVEGWFGRLWTQLSMDLPPAGHVGRFRGEMRAETADWTACREGRRDPRGLFPDLGEFLAALDRSIARLNTEPVESREYGTWVPAEAWAASARERRELPAGLWRLALPVREIRLVRNGSVQVTAADAWGGHSRFTFADRALAAFEGARVAVSFDPAAESESAVVELAERFADQPAGLLLAPAAVRVDARPRLVSGRVAWVSGAADASHERKAARRLVAEAVQTFDERGAAAPAATVQQPSTIDHQPAAATPQPPPEFYQEPDWAELERKAGLIA